MYLKNKRNVTYAKNVGLFRAEKLLFRNIQTAPPTLSLTAAGTDVILLDTKLVPCCISPSAAAAEPVNIGDLCTAKQTRSSLTVSTGDGGSTDHRTETGSSPSGSDVPPSRRYCHSVIIHREPEKTCHFIFDHNSCVP